jgi:hypothetical protein
MYISKDIYEEYYKFTAKKIEAMSETDPVALTEQLKGVAEFIEKLMKEDEK